MFNAEKAAPRSPELCKIVQMYSTSLHELPKGAVTLEVLRSMEVQLKSRGLVYAANGPDTSPVWFLAETERNVFLWRNGLSIEHASEFEFWVDTHRLIEKRINQLRCQNAENPFLNPLWGFAVADTTINQREVDYLVWFRDVIQKIEAHAHALSHLGSLLREEFGLADTSRPKVILPARQAALASEPDMA